MKKDKFNRRKNELLNTIYEYVDQDGKCDILRLRKERKDIYSKITYYFGSITQLLEDNGWVKTKDNINYPVSFKDKLAYYALTQLRKKYTLQDIAEYFNVSKICVRQMNNMLAKHVK